MGKLTNNQNQGFIKLYRSFIDWEWFNDKNASRLFIFCLLKATYTTIDWHGIKIEKGSFVCSIYSLSKQLNISLQSIRTAIQNLQSTNEITIKTSSQGTIIQVVKYKEYQLSTNEITNEQQTDNKPITTTKKEENVKNDKNDNIKKEIEILPLDKIEKIYFEQLDKKLKYMKVGSGYIDSAKALNNCSRFYTYYLKRQNNEVKKQKPYTDIYSAIRNWIGSAIDDNKIKDWNYGKDTSQTDYQPIQKPDAEDIEMKRILSEKFGKVTKVV